MGSHYHPLQQHQSSFTPYTSVCSSSVSLFRSDASDCRIWSAVYIKKTWPTPSPQTSLLSPLLLPSPSGVALNPQMPQHRGALQGGRKQPTGEQPSQRGWHTQAERQLWWKGDHFETGVWMWRIEWLTLAMGNKIVRDSRSIVMKSILWRSNKNTYLSLKYFLCTNGMCNITCDKLIAISI